ncbi:MAG: DUF2851 family protein [Sphingobacteriaceae bacterium]
MNFNEDLLHFFWKSKHVFVRPVYTLAGEPIELIRIGYQNTHAGPDFEEVQLKLGDTLWVGSVEMHLKSSDWYAHRHEQDKAYENVILHVVYEYDKPVFRADGSEIPVLLLKGLIPGKLVQNYRDLLGAQSWIPCAAQLASVEPIYRQQEVYRSLINRLEEKSEGHIQLLNKLKGNWDDAFYLSLAAGFGFKLNTLPFALLAQSVPQLLLAKYKNNSLQLEALLFGQAGLLQDNFTERYPEELKNEYHYLQQKHHLVPLDSSLWRFFRARPANFPSLRIAQFSALVQKSTHLFSTVLAMEHVADLVGLFQKLPVHSYWQNHYRFEKNSPKHSVQLGVQSIHSLLINTIATFLYAYGSFMHDERYKLRAIELLETLSAESNAVLREFAALGFAIPNAAASQGLLHLKKTACDVRNCVSCGIGAQILQKTSC